MNNVVTFGEIMLRLNTGGNERVSTARSFEASYGGGEANVAASLSMLGIKTQFVSRLPKNDLGEACLAFLKASNVGTDHIVYGGKRIGIYFLETGAAQRPSKVIYDRADSSFSNITPGMIDWDAIFQNASWFHWTGITPAVSQSAAEVCKEAILAAKNNNLTVSCDLNFRAKLWKWGKSAEEVMCDLVSLCDVAVGNEEDADKVFGIKAPECNTSEGLIDAQKYEIVCQELRRRFPALKTISITLRTSLSASHNRWSAVMWQDGLFLTGPEYDIQPVVDRVGTGDSFNAGLIYGLLQFPDDQNKVLRFALALSCLKHSIPGDFHRVSLAEIESLMEGNRSGRIIR